MAYDSRKLAAYGAAGLLIATFIILGVQLIPMPMPSIPTAKTGVLVLKITDAPPFMKPTSLNITIDSIMVHKKGNETWLTFELDENETFDLVELVNSTDLIGADQFPAGNYTMIKMHILNATADFEGGESGVELTVPSDYIKIPVRFAIVEGDTTSIILDITYDSAVVAAHHHLRPVVKPIVEKQPVSTASVEEGFEEAEVEEVEAEEEEVEAPEEEEEVEEEETEEIEEPEAPEEEIPEAPEEEAPETSEEETA